MSSKPLARQFQKVGLDCKREMKDRIPCHVPLLKGWGGGGGGTPASWQGMRWGELGGGVGRKG